MILDLGLIDYEEAYAIQKELVKRRKLGEIDDSVVVAEHRSVFTIGRAGNIENLLEDEDVLNNKGIKVLRVDRGGDITFHGPGQVVVYPIIDLRARDKDIHRYLRDLEEVVINFLQMYGVYAERCYGKTGVWVNNKKIASIGVAASNWVTYHGFSVNINVDLGYFSMMHPCGMKEIEATSLCRVLGRPIAMREAKYKIISKFNDAFKNAVLA